MKTRYDTLRNIFIQSSLTNAMLEQKVKALNKGFMFNGDMSYLGWRYVFAKDLTKKTLTNKLLELGFDNLTTIEIIDALNGVRGIVKELLDDAKAHVK